MAPLARAARGAAARAFIPMMLASGAPPILRAKSAAMRPTGSFTPASVTPTVSTAAFFARSTTSAGKSAHFVSTMNSAIRPVTLILRLLVREPSTQLDCP